MKNVPWTFWVMFFLVAGTGWGLWIYDKVQKPVPTHLVATPPAPSYAPPATSYPPNALNRPPANTAMPSQGLWQEYTIARQKVLHDNPDLASEYSEIQNEMESQIGKLNVAMVQVDPKVAPIIAKLDALRKQRMAAANALHPNPNLVPAPASTGK